MRRSAIRLGGSNELQTFDGKYWLSYLGGVKQGYETDPLAIGLAWTKNPTEAHEWSKSRSLIGLNTFGNRAEATSTWHVRTP